MVIDAMAQQYSVSSVFRAGCSGAGRSLLVLAAVALLSACGVQSDYRDLDEYVQRVKAGRPGRIDPVPEFKSYETYTYEVSKELRDPFQPAQEEADMRTVQSSTNGIAPDTRRNREALEKFPLDALHFAGHLQQGDQHWAIITSPDGLVHRVQAGNYLGQNHGQIREITETQVTITEIVPDGLGGWIERQAALTLNED